MKFLFLLLFVLACTRLKERKEQVAAWTGRDIGEVKRHPEFSHMRPRMKDGKYIFAVGNPSFRMGAADEFWCEHIFTVEASRIVHYEQYGPCPYRKELDPTASAAREGF